MKELAQSWTLTEKSALLKFTPNYLHYILATAPSLLAKIFGFYSLTYKSSSKEFSIDLYLMENLFHGLEITRKFDLKGAPNRSSNGEVMLDSDWVNGNFSSQFPMWYYSKDIIQLAINNDTKFLAGQNIMDYSLLVGASLKTTSLVCGIVDYIGQFTLFKNVESQSKSIRSGPGISTVLPPAAYAARFCAAMNSNFLAVPNYWYRGI